MHVPELTWLSYISPVTQFYKQRIAILDLRGKRLACCQHITLTSIPMFMALHEAGVTLQVASCNLHSTDDRAVAFLREHGLSIHARSGMSMSEYEENLDRVAQSYPEYLHDMGGELISRCFDQPIKAALEATTSGLSHLAQHRFRFPVFNWNDVAFKNNLHNRFHVGDSVLNIFSHITGLSLFGRPILVLGFGPVGRGIATRAHVLGAHVYVCEIDPVRKLEALHHGLNVVDIFSGLAQCKIVITATGHKRVLHDEHFNAMQSGTILCNAGHSNLEIDIEKLQTYSHHHIAAHIEEFSCNDSKIFLIARGSLLNLATNTGLYGRDVFDFYEGFMLRAISWMLEGNGDTRSAQMHAFPNEIAHEVAENAFQLYRHSPYS